MQDDAGGTWKVGADHRRLRGETQARHVSPHLVLPHFSRSPKAPVTLAGLRSGRAGKGASMLSSPRIAGSSDRVGRTEVERDLLFTQPWDLCAQLVQSCLGTGDSRRMQNGRGILAALCRLFLSSNTRPAWPAEVRPCGFPFHPACGQQNWRPSC